MKILICFPAKGKTVDEIQNLRQSTEKKARRAFKCEEEIDILDPFTLASAPQAGQKDSIKFLADVITYLINADGVYFAKNWSTDRYCKVTFSAVQQYGIKYYSE